MLGNRTSEQWISEYATSHRHPVNRACHTVGIPMIALSLLLALAGFVLHALWPWAAALFVVGWIFQFVGHSVYEKRSPAFLTNALHLLVGPLWILNDVVHVVK